MKLKITITFIVLSFLSCSKENVTQQRVGENNVDDAVAVLNPRIPLNDLGTGTYMGYTGGLYPGGANLPSGQYAVDLLQVSSSIVPIDTFGNSSSTKRKFVFFFPGGQHGRKKYAGTYS